ncbi:hypothetical protein EVAR_52291_1, partial [Eumeta japonica]
ARVTSVPIAITLDTHARRRPERASRYPRPLGLRVRTKSTVTRIEGATSTKELWRGRARARAARRQHARPAKHPNRFTNYLLVKERNTGACSLGGCGVFGRRGARGAKYHWHSSRVSEMCR